MPDALLEVDSVTFAAGGRQILFPVSLAVGARETVAVLGPSGCGKTTLLRLIAGLERPASGRVLFDGEDVTGLPPHRRAFGMMFQEFVLFPHLDVEHNVAFGLRHSRFPRGQHPARVAALLEMAGLSGYEKRTTEALSGGERQRVALARALAPEPRLLMLDEPLGSLDRVLRERLLVELRAILLRLEVPSVYVTHDQAEAFAIADRVAIMNAGRLVRVGTPEEIYGEPRTAFVARFLGMDNIVDGHRTGAGVVETPVGLWTGLAGPPGPVHLLLRNEGARVVEAAAERTVRGTLISRLFQGAHTRILLATPAGTLEFDLHGAGALPPEGAAVHVLVPNAQVLAPERETEPRPPGSG